MAITVSPAQPNQTVTEARWVGMNKAAWNQSRRETGLDLSVNSGLDLDVGTGVAIVSGYRVEVTATETVTLTDNATNYVWLQVDGTVYDSTSTTPSAATDFLLGVANTSSGNIVFLYASRELSQNTGPEIENQLLNYAATSALNTGNSLTAIATLDLEPGLYWIRGIIRASGQALSLNQSWSLEFDVATAAEYGIELAFLNHGDEGAADDSAWPAVGVAESFIATSNLNLHPTQIVGMVYLADTGSIVISASTSSHFAVNVSHITARKIA